MNGLFGPGGYLSYKAMRDLITIPLYLQREAWLRGGICREGHLFHGLLSGPGQKKKTFWPRKGIETIQHFHAQILFNLLLPLCQLLNDHSSPELCLENN